MDTYHYEGEVSYKTISKPHGRGTLTCYAQGGGSGAEDAFSWKYEGEFDEGHVTGRGRWYYPDRAMQYDGDFQRQGYHGRGTSYRHDGTIREDGTREDGTREYEGTWQKSCWKGNGILYRPDDSISREGEWVNGGSEEYEWQGETCWYEGDWDEEGSAHGWGILYRPDRITVVREGWWQNGEPVDGPPPGDPDVP